MVDGLHDLIRRLKPFGGVGLAQPVDQGFQGFGNTRRVQRHSLFPQHFHRIGSDVGTLPAKGRQKQGAQRVKVAARVGLPGQLLWRCIGVFPGKFVADNRLRTRIGILGDTKVDDDRLFRHPAFQDDVVGRQVAVDDPPPMRYFQTIRHATAHLDQISCRHPAVLHQQVERRPVDVIHQQIDMPVRRAMIFGIAHDRIMADFADFLFPAHQRQIALVARKFGLQRLDRHEAFRHLVARLVDFRRAAATKNDLDPVGVVQQVARLKNVARSRFSHPVPASVRLF